MGKVVFIDKKLIVTLSTSTSFFIKVKIDLVLNKLYL